MSVVIETTIGDITVDLFTEERPVACLNFIKLCQLKYYNFNLFHTVEQGFIAQTGDPTGVGNGGSSVWGVVEDIQKRFFEGESLPKIYHSSAGLLSLVSAGKNLMASQFFFTLGSNLTSLDGTHCVIGEVVEGHETLRKLNEAIVDENFRPYQDIRITHTVVLDDPFPNPRGYSIPSRSPSPSAERLKNGRIAADEDIDDTDGKTMQEIQEILAEREAKARATILEIVGDLPDADMAPPENVLFVCKLNPVTTDDDLEIIFSRFGRVKSCEVIRDRKSGDSLQYAFVEFKEKKSCEAAYFKMDNVLIDDRRIHVDFSQSVSKVKWRGKGRGVEGQDGRLDFNNLRAENNRDDDRRRQRPHQRDQQQQERQQRSGESERARMTSEERRREREKRHRLQREAENKRRRSRSRSRSPSNKQLSGHGHNSGRQTNIRWQQQERRPAHENWHRQELRRYSRSPIREPARRRDSPERRNIPLPQKHNDNGKGNMVRGRNRDVADRKQTKSLDDGKGTLNANFETHKRHTSTNRGKYAKKSQRRASTSGDETYSSDKSGSSDTDSNNEDSSASESTSSSGQERKKKKKKQKQKKDKKSHKHKSKSSKKKKKKSRR